MGTCNALLSLGTDQYLEIIAPDPDQDIKGTLGEQLIERGHSGIRSWAVATNDLGAVDKVARKLNLNPQPIVDMNRTTPEGLRLDWQLLFVSGRLLPFFIDWKDSPHPALSAPPGCTLETFNVSVEDYPAYRALMRTLAIDVSVVHGPGDLSARIVTPRGLVVLPGW